MLIIFCFVSYSKSSETKLFRTCSLNEALTKSDQEENLTLGIKTYIIYNKIHTQSSTRNNVYASLNMLYLGTVDWGGGGGQMRGRVLCVSFTTR